MVMHKTKWHKTTHTQMNSSQNWWNLNSYVTCTISLLFLIFCCIYERCYYLRKLGKYRVHEPPVHFLLNFLWIIIISRWKKSFCELSFSEAAVSSSDHASIVAYLQTGIWGRCLFPYSFFPPSLSFFICKSGTGLNCWGLSRCKFHNSEGLEVKFWITSNSKELYH